LTFEDNKPDRYFQKVKIYRRKVSMLKEYCYFFSNTFILIQTIAFSTARI
jgi:hypothetical protein